MKRTAHSHDQVLGSNHANIGKLAARCMSKVMSSVKVRLIMMSLIGSFIAGAAACNDDDSTSESQTCGGIAGLSCDANEFCKYPLDAMCGAADATGVCESIPQVCADIHQPVCGCDGKTYPNECTANSAGVSAAQSGECTNESTLGKSCGGKVAEQPRACDAGQFCNYRPEDICGRADAPGICNEIPMACDEIAAPVCGCDGKDYDNACKANAAGTAVEKMDPCTK